MLDSEPQGTFHVIADPSYLVTIVCSLERLMITSKAQTHWGGIIYLDVGSFSASDQVPTFLKALSWTCQFEVVHVDHEKEIEVTVEKY